MSEKKIKYMVCFVSIIILFMISDCQNNNCFDRTTGKANNYPNPKGYYLVKIIEQAENEYAGFIVRGTNRVMPYEQVLKEGIYCATFYDIIQNIVALPPKSEIMCVDYTYFLNAKEYLTGYSNYQISKIKKTIEKRNVMHVKFLE